MANVSKKTYSRQRQIPWFAIGICAIIVAHPGDDTHYLRYRCISGVATDQTRAVKSRLKAKPAITMISVGMNMIVSIRTGTAVQC